jgi:hypothetical protein
MRFTIHIPDSMVEPIQEIADREHVPVRQLLMWQLKRDFGLPIRPLPRTLRPPETDKHAAVAS